LEKGVAAFQKDHAQSKKLERDGDSTQSHRTPGIIQNGKGFFSSQQGPSVGAEIVSELSPATQDGPRP
jgi:hypothetical protein